MTRLGPVSRQELVDRLRTFGYAGPYAGGRQEFMLRGEVRLILPNPHRGELSVDLIARILRQAGISRRQWSSEQ